MKSRLTAVAYALTLALGIVPLWWGAGPLPLVDLPQHLHLISVLHRLHDPTTLYPQVFELRSGITPYLGYYYLVSLLNWLMPLEMANKVFLSAYVVGLPLAMGFLLRSLGRPRWPSLLALPFAYGDSFAWGFINYCAALPLALLSCGLFVRALADAAHRRRWAAWSAGVLVAVLLFHVQAFAFLACALPFLLFTTRVPEDAEPGPRTVAARLRPRAWALFSVVPSVVLFLVWVVGRIGEPAQVEAGAPWKAWGPMLSARNLSFKPFDVNWADLTGVLANELRSGEDRLRLWAALLLAVAAWAVGLAGRGGVKRREGPWERWRLLGLSALALVLYFTLPFDIRGYMYYLNTRFAHLAAPLLLCAVPAGAAGARRWLTVGAVAMGVLLAVPLARGYAAFGEEASALEALAPSLPERPRVMGLIFNTASSVVTHPVYLHAATVLARLRGGVTNFSFALTPHSPLKFSGEPPPTFPSEWRPQDFDFQTMGGAYDAFLVRGAPPGAVFGPQLREGSVAVIGHEGTFWLVGRR